MSQGSGKISGRAFGGGVADLCARHAIIALALAALSIVYCGWLAAHQLTFEAGQEGLVAQDQPFFDDIDHFYEVFPQLKDTLLVVIDAANMDDAEDLAATMAAKLRAEPELFASVYYPEEDPFFKRNALLFLDVDELNTLVDRLAKAQPALAALSREPNLKGFFSLVDVGVTALESGNDLPPAFTQMMEETAAAVTDLAEGRDLNLSWSSQMMGADDARARIRILMVQPPLERDVMVERRMVKRLRELAAEPDTSRPGASISVTGRLALAYDEIETAKRGVGLAGTVSLLCLGFILFLGLPSLRMNFAILVTLVAGLAWSLGFAAVAVGSLNLISATFAVLFIGLGVAHALHVCLRYREYLMKGMVHFEAIGKAARTTGGAVTLCALTTAIGFAAFVPTAFLGIAELGLIAAGGMGFALVAAFTVLPATLTLVHSEQAEIRKPLLHPLGALISPKRRFAFLGAVFGIIGGIYVALTGVQFNFSVMSIRDPGAQSVQALAFLQEQKIESDFIIMALAPNLEAGEILKHQLSQLPEVSEVRTPLTYVAQDQEEKLYILEDATFFLGPALQITPQPPLTEAERLAAAQDFVDQLATATGQDREALAALEEVADAFNAILNSPDAAARLSRVEEGLTGTALKQIERLQLLLQAEPYGLDDLPQALKDRLVAADGEVRISVFPAEDIVDVKALTRFVQAVKPLAPQATGRPVIETGVGEIVVASFIQAGLYAFFAITLLLFLVLRNTHDTSLVLVPIILAGLLTIATANYFGIPFNFANVIAIPLIFGLGVDSAIHFVLRAKEEHSPTEVVASSTPQAILLSSLTTIGAFASLSLSPHKGIASMGTLLTIGITWSLICTLLVLPALLRISHEARSYLRKSVK